MRDKENGIGKENLAYSRSWYEIQIQEVHDTAGELIEIISRKFMKLESMASPPMRKANSRQFSPPPSAHEAQGNTHIAVQHPVARASSKASA